MLRVSLNYCFSRTSRLFQTFVVNDSKVKPDNYLNIVNNRENKIMLPQVVNKLISGRENRDKTNSSQLFSEIKKSLSEKYKVAFEQSPDKSESDTKEYMVMKLSNGLTALLISDATNMMEASDFDTDKQTQKEILQYGFVGMRAVNARSKEKLAACSITVGVGSFHDPERIPGLAHLLEHVLSMGSVRFPNENEFNSFLSARGGSNNAATDTESTTFFFDCPEKSMADAMDRFADFFVSPLMRREVVMRERHAIESEFQMHSKNDVLRIQQIIASTASSTNPVRKFMWGNLKTLQEGVDEDELYNSLREFQKSHYSADRMTVTVQARLPLSTLGRWVAERFGSVPVNDRPKELFPSIDPLFLPEAFNKMYTVMPVSDVSVLTLTWALPPIQHLYRTKPMLYPSFLVNNESKGSLTSYLKKKLWALNVVAANGNDGTDNNSIFSLFSIGILLTEGGLQNVEGVLLAVFNYIKMLQEQTPSDTIFKEIKFLADTNFRFAPEITSSEYVQYMSQCMRLYPSTDYVTGSALLFECNPEQVSNFLKLLTPDKVNVLVLSKKAADATALGETEKWFGSKYNLSNIPKKWMNEWRTCEPNPDFFVPPPNPFIPSDFRILPGNPAQSAIPEKLICNLHMELWFKQDKMFRLPFAYINVYMISPYAGWLPETFVMCDLFVTLFSVLYDERIYPASVAGLSYSLFAADCGLILSVSGYNEKLPPFLMGIMDMMVELGRKLTPDLFETVKEAQRKFYYNNVLNPTALAKEMRLSLLCDPFCTSMTKLEAISAVDVVKMKQFCINLLGNLYVKCLIQGNVSKDQAIDVSAQIRSKFFYCPPLAGSRPKVRVRQIPKGENLLRVKALNEQDRNCHVTDYYQCGLCCDLTESCLVELLMMYMAEPLFDTLRTKEQLGYFVANELKYTYGVLGFTLAVKFQSDKFTVQHVESRIAEFLEKMKAGLKNMTLEEFNRLRSTLTTLKQQADTQLADEVERNWSEIETDEYVFDRLQREINYLRSLEQRDFLKYVNDVFDNTDGSTGDRCMRKISVQVDAGDSKSHKREDTSARDLKHVLELCIPDDNKTEAKFIRNVEDFQTSLFIYPILKIKS